MPNMKIANLQVVLVEPNIPQNTGTIARLLAANCLKLHLIKPLGFSLSDKYLKRAGLDYWEYVKINVHESFDDFLLSEEISETDVNSGRLKIFTTKGENNIFSCNYSDNDILIFGNETSGLSDLYHEKFKNFRYLIPMIEPGIRSLNLSNAVSIVTYEALRQLNFQTNV